MAEEDLIFGKNRHFFGGIEPSNMRKFTASIVDGTVKLDMQLPKDTVVNGHTLCSVAGAVVRRKTDGYPINEFDGELVKDFTINEIDNDYLDSAAMIGRDGVWVTTYDGRIYNSQDGITWVYNEINDYDIEYIHYENNMWIACCDANGIFYSTDGVTWTQSNITSGYGTHAEYANNIWVAYTSNNTSGIDLYYSEDGKTWIGSDSTIVGGITHFRYTNNMWYGISTNCFYYSEDGKIWNKGDSVNGEIYTYYYENGLWVISVANTGNTTSGTGLYYSEDGKTWTQSNVTAGRFYRIHYANGLFVAGDSNNTGYGLYYSEDGKTWTQSTLSSGRIIDIAYHNNLWVTARAVSSTSYYVYSSEDGKTWKAYSDSPTDQCLGLYHYNDVWYMGTSSGIYYTTDRNEWYKTNLTKGQVRDIIYADNILVAGTNRGLYYSHDGMTWTQSNITGGTFYTVLCNKIPGASEYYYSAFPYTTQGVYNISPVNRAYVSASGPSDPSNPDTPNDPLTGSYFYGYDLDLTDSDPATRVSYPEEVDNANFTPVKMGTSRFDYGGWNIAPGEQFMPRPCMLKYDGSVAYYLNPDNYTQKEDGTGSDVADIYYDSNAMMEWPKIYTKRWEENGVYHFRCSDVKIDDDYECWCNYDKNDNEIDHFYTGIYLGVNADGQMRSIRGTRSAVSKTWGDFNTEAGNNGDDWYLEFLSDRLLIQDLLVMMGKSTDGQTVYGNGGPGDQINGLYDDKGMFYGTPGVDGNPVKVFGMEHWWGYRQRYLMGLLYDGEYVKYKITTGKKDGSRFNTFLYNGSGFLYYGTKSPTSATNIAFSSGYYSNAMTESYGRLPVGGSGSGTTYECDKFSMSATSDDIYYAVAGGYYTGGQECGPFNISIGIKQTVAINTVCAALSCKPSAK